jgi:acetyl esterase/lipase
MRDRKVLLLVVGVLLVTLGLLPAVQARGKAAAVLAESLEAPLPRPFAADVRREPADLDGVTGHLYRPGAEAPAVVLVPGAARRGKDDPRVVRLARAIARAERVVFVPDLSLAQARFDPVDIDRLVRAVAALRGQPGVRGRVALLGFSVGGSFALVAAADRRISTEVAAVATFGAYFDLLGCIQAATTGVSVAGGRRWPWQADPRARQVLRDIAVQFTEPAGREPLRAALEGRRSAARLPGGARAAYDLVTNTDPERTYALGSGLDPTGRRLLARFSPATVATEVLAPVLAVHSFDDPLVPYGELHRLAAGLPGARTMTVRSFRHVDPGSDGSRLGLLRDLVTSWRFTAQVLAHQESFADR